MNLQRYLQRIGYSGPVTAEFDVLKSIAYKHPTSFPFENLNPFLGMPVDISTEAIEQKLVENGRGGYCFEQNSLLRDALLAIGFNVISLNARVLYMRPDDSLPPRSHMLLQVEVEGRKFLVDGGFGGATPTTPLEFVHGKVQQSSHEDYRLSRVQDEWLVEVKKNGTWEAMYQFDLQPQIAADYAFANFFHSHCPDSIFKTNLIAALPVEGGRYSLNNNQLSFHPIDAPPERRLLESPQELAAVLREKFRINTAGLTNLDAQLGRFFTNAAV